MWADFSVKTDLSGNVYVAGEIGIDTVNFWGIALMNNGLYNYFLVKYDSLGNSIWVKNVGGYSSVIYPISIATDTSNNVYFTGTVVSPRTHNLKN